MYGFIWRRLPFGVPGKIIGSLVLTLAAAALLWYLVFPAIDPHLPFNDGQVTSQDGSIGGTAPTGPAEKDNVVPASPSPTR